VADPEGTPGAVSGAADQRQFHGVESLHCFRNQAPDGDGNSSGVTAGFGTTPRASARHPDATAHQRQPYGLGSITSRRRSSLVYAPSSICNPRCGGLSRERDRETTAAFFDCLESRLERCCRSAGSRLQAFRTWELSAVTNGYGSIPAWRPGCYLRYNKVRYLAAYESWRVPPAVTCQSAFDLSKNASNGGCPSGASMPLGTRSA
jgi:hypothetical protein